MPLTTNNKPRHPEYHPSKTHSSSHRRYTTGQNERSRGSHWVSRFWRAVRSHRLLIPNCHFRQMFLRTCRHRAGSDYWTPRQARVTTPSNQPARRSRGHSDHVQQASLHVEQVQDSVIGRMSCQTPLVGLGFVPLRSQSRTFYVNDSSLARALWHGMQQLSKSTDRPVLAVNSVVGQELSMDAKTQCF